MGVSIANARKIGLPRAVGIRFPEGDMEPHRRNPLTRRPNQVAAAQHCFPCFFKSRCQARRVKYNMTYWMDLRKMAQSAMHDTARSAAGARTIVTLVD